MHTRCGLFGRDLLVRGLLVRGSFVRGSFVRGFLVLGSFVLSLGALLPASDARAQTVQAHIVVQSSPLAGFRHYEAPNLWGEVKPGDALTLVREPDNPHDRNAVRVEWRSYKLGYVPRAENETVSRLLDGGTRLAARVSKVRPARAPNRRIEFEIYMPTHGP